MALEMKYYCAVLRGACNKNSQLNCGEVISVIDGSHNPCPSSSDKRALLLPRHCTGGEPFCEINENQVCGYVINPGEENAAFVGVIGGETHDYVPPGDVLPKKIVRKLKKCNTKKD